MALHNVVASHKVAEVGSLSARAKMLIKMSSGVYLPFFATNTLFLHVIALLQI